MFPINCTTCGKQFSIPDDIYERRVKGRVVTIRCKQCKADIRVDGRAEAPGQEPGAADVTASEPAEPDAAAQEATEAKPPPKQDAAPEEPDQPERVQAALGQTAASKVESPKPVAPPPERGKGEAARQQSTKTEPSRTKARSQQTTAKADAWRSSPDAAAAPSVATAPRNDPTDHQKPAPALTPVKLPFEFEEEPSFQLASPAQASVSKASPAVRPKFESSPRVPGSAGVPAAKLGTQPIARPKFESRPQLGLTGTAPRSPAEPLRSAAGASLPRPALDSRPRFTPVAARAAPVAPAPVAPAPTADATAAVMPGEEPQPSSRPAKPAQSGRTSVPPSFPPGSQSEPPLEALWAVDYGEDDRELTGPQIADDFKSGAIELETLVWHLGMPEWRPIAEVPELAAYLASAAPAAYQAAAQKLVTKAQQAADAEGAGNSEPPGETTAPVTLPGPPPVPAEPARARVPATPASFSMGPDPEALIAAQQQKRRVVLLIGTVLLVVVALALVFLVMSSTGQSSAPAGHDSAVTSTAVDEVARAKAVDGTPSEQPAEPAAPSQTTASERGDNAVAARGKSFAEMFATAAADASVGTKKMGPFDSKSAQAKLRSASDRVRQCRKSKSLPGKADLVVTFAPSGRVTQAEVVGGPFKGTPIGTCIANAVSSVRIAPFSGPDGVVKTSYVLR